jgi:V/A-type H+/Na+-transporting ATPase subunit E
MDQVEELEKAILARAGRLAEEVTERARRSRERILREAADKLRLREEREVMLAKALAERTYRRAVQSHELKLQKETDLLRWSLVQQTMQGLRLSLQQIVHDEARYFPLLQGLLREGARQIEDERLVASFNRRDRQHLLPRWAALIAGADTDKQIMLGEESPNCSGGVLIHSPDQRIRLDNTFEGRLRRLEPELHRIILERLLPAGAEGGIIFSG